MVAVYACICFYVKTMGKRQNRYNAATYRGHMYRVRKGCELDDRLGEYIADGQSVNWLITELLCQYFDVPMPHRYRFVRHVSPLVNAPDEKEKRS